MLKRMGVCFLSVSGEPSVVEICKCFFFFKLVNMAHNEASLMKLNKEDLVRTTLSLSGKV